MNLNDSRRFAVYSDQQYDDPSMPLRPINLPRGQIVHMTQRSNYANIDDAGHR